MKKYLFLLTFALCLIFGGKVLAITNCDDKPKPALSCLPGYSMTCSFGGGEYHWACGKESRDAIITADDLGTLTSIGTLPTSPWYFLKEWKRGIKMFFIFNSAAKANLELNIANEKSSEALKVSENSPENAEAIKKALKNYENSAKKLKEKLSKLSETSENPNIKTLIEKVDERLQKHSLLFEEILEKQIDKPKYEEISEKIKESQEKSMEAIFEALKKGKKSKERAEIAIKEAQIAITLIEKELDELLNSHPVLKEIGSCQAKCRDQYGGSGSAGFDACVRSCDALGPAGPARIDGSANEQVPISNKILNTVVQSIGKFLEQAKKHFKIAQQSFNEEKYGEAFSQAAVARVQANNALRRINKIESLITKKEIRKVCAQQYDPVCGTNNKTYSNACMAELAEVKIKRKGECKVSKQEEVIMQEIELTPINSNVGGSFNVKEISQFTIEADDNGFYPSSEIKIKKGEGVRLIFNIRTANVYYGGLEIKSSKFETGPIKPGESATVEFVAKESFTFTSYWPAASAAKASGKVIAQ